MDDKITAHTYKNRLFIIGMFIDKHLQDTIKKGGMKLKNYEHFE